LPKRLRRIFTATFVVTPVSEKGVNPAFCTRGAGRTCGLEGQDPDAERGATQIEYLFIVPDERRYFDLA